MNRKLITLLGMTVALLLTVSMISAQNRPNYSDNPRDRHNQVLNNGFDSTRGNMSITGEVEVTDAIYITLTAQPTLSANEWIRENPRGQTVIPEDFTNEITISITTLIEFIDIGNDGFDENDTQISSYLLNSDNLNDPVLTTDENGTTYTISSFDDSFILFLYLNEADGTIHSWKWSIELEYDFVQIDTQLAIIQEIISNRMPLAGPIHEGQGHRIMERELRDNHDRVPMYFKWDDTALVDGETQNVTASRSIMENNSVLALSMPQGDSIFYDPEIGVDIEAIDDAQSFIEQFIDLDLVDAITSPTIIGLSLAGVMIVAVVVFQRIRR